MATVHTWVLDCGSLETISPISQAVRALAEAEQGPEAANDIEMALVEALTNVIKHGYGPEGGQIGVEFTVAYDSLDVRIFDWGQPIPNDSLIQVGVKWLDFDPTDLEALPENGMGLSIISLVMDEVIYSSDKGQNVLTLRRSVRR